MTAIGPKSDRHDGGVDRFISHDLLLVLAFCALGLVVTLNVMLRFPEFGVLIESCNQF
jgi:hypothetical protein